MDKKHALEKYTPKISLQIICSPTELYKKNLAFDKRRTAILLRNLPRIEIPELLDFINNSEHIEKELNTSEGRLSLIQSSRGAKWILGAEKKNKLSGSFSKLKVNTSPMIAVKKEHNISNEEPIKQEYLPKKSVESESKEEENEEGGYKDAHEEEENEEGGYKDAHQEEENEEGGYKDAVGEESGGEHEIRNEDGGYKENHDDEDDGIETNYKIIGDDDVHDESNEVLKLPKQSDEEEEMSQKQLKLEEEEDNQEEDEASTQQGYVVVEDDEDTPFDSSHSPSPSSTPRAETKRAKTRKHSIIPKEDSEEEKSKKIILSETESKSSSSTPKGTPRFAKSSYTIRDFDYISFNNRFQGLIDELDTLKKMHKEDSVEMQETSMRLIQLAQDFVSSATIYGKLIISEHLLPLEMRTIKPTNKVGGYLGGDKYIVNDVLFKFANDAHGIFKQLLTIGQDPVWAANKVAGHELKGCIDYFRTRTEGLCFPLVSFLFLKKLNSLLNFPN